jgi:hypothetical protein
MQTTSYTYFVTVDVPAGISNGTSYGDDLAAASDAFGEASKGTYPNGTVVRLVEEREGDYYPGTTVLDKATVTEQTKAEARAAYEASLAEIVARANARTAEKIAKGL